MRFGILILVLMMGCGKPPVPDVPTDTADPSGGSPFVGGDGNGYSPEIPVSDTAFSQLLDKFVELDHSYGGNSSSSAVTILFGDTASHGARVIGFCQISGPARYVVISREFWYGSDALTAESLLFHELGHCLLNRAHLYDRRPNRDLWPVSLMNGYIVRSDMYGTDYNYYQQELFTVKFPRLDMQANGENTISDELELHEEPNGGCVAYGRSHD